MTSQTPRISIILPIRNVASYVGQTIDTVLAQTYQNWELIAMDGASTDGTIEIVRAYAARDPRIRFYSEPDESTWHAVDKSLHLAGGAFITIICGQDGYLDNKWLAKCAEVFEKNPTVSLAWALDLGMSPEGKLNTETQSYYSQFIKKETPFDVAKNLAAKVGRMIRELIFGSWQRKKILLTTIFSKNARLKLNALTKRSFAEYPQKEQWIDYWLSTGLTFPDQSMVIAKNVFMRCTPPYELGSKSLGKLSDFYFNFSSQGFLPYFIPTHATFGRQHENASKDRGTAEIHNNSQTYLNNVIDFGKKLKKEHRAFIFRDREGHEVGEKKF